MPWILNEDEALKTRLAGINLQGIGEIPVRFSTPETEAAPMEYPSITITRANISPATDREHRGTVSVDYGPEGAEVPGPDDRWGWYAECPLPYNFDYQIVARSRFQAHQSALTALLATEHYLPYRFGSLEIPQRRVQVSMDVIGGPATHDFRDDDDKRVFETHFLVRVFSELTPWDIDRLTFPDVVDGSVSTLDGKKLLTSYEVTADVE
jgi:hypothetical protein